MPFGAAGQSPTSMHGGLHPPKVGSIGLSEMHAPPSHMPITLTQSPYGGMPIGSSPKKHTVPMKQNMSVGQSAPQLTETGMAFDTASAGASDGYVIVLATVCGSELE